MLIFNCTEAASNFFSRVYKGKKISPVDKPPSPTIEGDEQGEFSEQWLVHAITVQRKHVLFVIHVPTRYCMIFAESKKADVEGFIQRFSDRWINGLMGHGLQHHVLQWIGYDAMLERFKESCGQYRLYKRGHRGARKHIDEIARFFERLVAESGCLPPNDIAIRVDALMNDRLRHSKDCKKYYYPYEEMMAHWLRQYCGIDEDAIQALRDLRKQLEVGA